MSIIKRSLKRIVDLSVGAMGKTPFGRYFYGQIIESAMARTQAVEHGGVKLAFAVPNALNQYRVDTFGTKESGAQFELNDIYEVVGIVKRENAVAA